MKPRQTPRDRATAPPAARPRRWLTVLFACCLLWVLSPAQTLADRQACLSEVPSAERDYGILPGLLEAIAYVESAWDGTPWPWTLNLDQQPLRLTSKADALALMTRPDGSLHPRMAVGCMQIYSLWHAQAFESPDAMLDPRNNVRYAASYLAELKRRHGTWTRAVARYHAGLDNHRAQRRYVCRVMHYQVRLNSGRLTDTALALCSGRWAAYLEPDALSSPLEGMSE